MPLPTALVIAWAGAMCSWVFLVFVWIAFASHDGPHNFVAGVVFGGLVATMVLWNMANKRRPYAGVLFGLLAGSVVCILWWMLVAGFGLAQANDTVRITSALIHPLAWMA